MAITSSIILFFSIIVFFFGQLLRINIGSINFPLFDIALFLLFLLNIFYQIKYKKLKIKNHYFLAFLVIAWLSFLINHFLYDFNLLKPSLYLLLLTILLSFFIIPIHPNLISPKVRYFFSLSLIANIVFGLIQYFIWPNFTYFDASNWDPHLYRLVSTFFDPTFTGLIYLFFIIYVYLSKKFPYKNLILIISYFAMVLTYSRSTFLAFILVFAFISFKLKNLKIFIFSFVLIATTIILLPRMPGEGTKLERSSSIKAKIENYKEGINVFTKSPLLGVGYNNLFYIRNSTNPLSHSISGFDSSLLTILTTTGIFGLVFFILGIYKKFITSELIQQSILIAVLFHSLFANSLLYPWVLFFIFLI
ncbi:MAG: O-antigen ligase family protein [Candidatus Shapirobacteria bacterium]|nr:O-antigen ligase family protein [Candidatus Shapirobacteria bacterium]